MKSILIVDDDEIFLAALGQLLGMEGYTSYATADGPQAISIYAGKRPDLVLLDVGLPSMSGIDVLRGIRMLDPDAKVIVITGYKSDELRRTVFQFGALDVLVKPVGPDLLRETISAAMNTTI